MRHSDAVDRVGILRTERGKAAACFPCGNPQLLDQLRNVRFIRAKLRKIARHADAAEEFPEGGDAGRVRQQR